MQRAWIAALLFAILVALFAVQNTTPVSVSFLFWSANEVAVALVIVVSAAVGALITLLLGAPAMVRGQLRRLAYRRERREFQRRIGELQAELEQVKGRPLVKDLTPLPWQANAPEPPTQALEPPNT